ncbi:hypothetical protein HY971_00280 [Candidatus Kaiserbacteria bacterium]|nr:hypothetical protein [Candidatus Kaiserbacteria bacterium]
MSTRLVGNTHLVAGNAEIIPQVLAVLEREGVRTQGNPDIYIREYSRFGIDEARELRERANSRAIAGGSRTFIIATPGMTNEAQNALLKTLEEPPADASFFFIVPSPEMLLQTLRSRAQMLELQHAESVHTLSAKDFLAAAPQKRLDMLKPLLEKDEDDKRDISSIIGFLSSLERLLKKKPEGLHAIYRARKYIGDKGALIKPLLEQVALLVPKV